MANRKRGTGRRWQGAGSVNIGGDGGMVKRQRLTVRRYASGRFAPKGRGKPSVVQVFRDLLTGRTVTEKKAKSLKGRPIPIRIERHYRRIGKRGEMMEAGYRASYRIKLPASLRRQKPGAIVDAVIKKMRAEGHKKLPRIGKGKRKRDQVRFFWFLEGQAYDEKARKRIRAGTGGPWRRSLDQVDLEAKSKIRALFEGQKLANDPHKTVGSGKYTMKSGPDTIYITAVYGEDVPVPGIDIPFPKRRKAR